MKRHNSLSFVVWAPLVVAVTLSSAARADIGLDWRVHKNTATPDTTINAWQSEGNTRINQDDDAGAPADVACAVTFRSSSITRDWTYSDGDDVIDNEAELFKAFAAIRPKNAAVLTKDLSNPAPGVSYNKIVIIFGTPDASTLVHEVGHVAGLAHVAVEKRFMTPSNHEALNPDGPKSRKRVTQPECDSYKTLN